MPRQMHFFGSEPPPVEGPAPESIPIVPIIEGLWAPPDVEAAHGAWGANCGPCALAALLGRAVDFVRGAFPWFPSRPWTTASQAVQAVTNLGHGAALHTDWQGIAHIGPPVALPPAALLQIQWTGPWTAPGASPRWAYTQTHFVASLHGGAAIYDVNLGAWTRAEHWMKIVAPVLVRDVPRADGGWWIRSVVEVSLRGLPANGARRSAWIGGAS